MVLLESVRAGAWKRGHLQKLWLRAGGSGYNKAQSRKEHRRNTPASLPADPLLSFWCIPFAECSWKLIGKRGGNISRHIQGKGEASRE